MYAVFHAPAATSLQGLSPKALGVRMIAALLAAEARAKSRRDYARMLESDEMMRDVGVHREDVLRAMESGRS